ncbi:MAG: cytochrome c biogenesis CcdA family protein [Treponema sp.]|nr:cytochrome c biogenesis CcdA family protein [Treponema sp.]
MIEDISLGLNAGIAFSAGLLAFLSPCILPLIPSYLGILGGVGIQQKGRLVLTATCFVLGFSVLFIAFGVVMSTTFLLMGGVLRYINIAAGIIVIILGLNILFDFLSFLNYEKRPFLEKSTRGITAGKIPGPISAFLAGAAFGAGWTPCIGPILTSILFMASYGGQTGTAIIYLALFSAGLGLPFILAGIFFEKFIKISSRLRSRLLLIRRISGILLIIIGIMILTGQYSALTMRLL